MAFIGQEDIEVLIHIENNEVTGANELTHLNYNTLYNTYKFPGGAIR